METGHITIKYEKIIKYGSKEEILYEIKRLYEALQKDNVKYIDFTVINDDNEKEGWTLNGITVLEHGSVLLHVSKI